MHAHRLKSYQLLPSIGSRSSFWSISRKRVVFFFSSYPTEPTPSRTVGRVAWSGWGGAPCASVCAFISSAYSCAPPAAKAPHAGIASKLASANTTMKNIVCVRIFTKYIVRVLVFIPCTFIHHGPLLVASLRRHAFALVIDKACDKWICRQVAGRSHDRARGNRTFYELRHQQTNRNIASAQHT